MNAATSLVDLEVPVRAPLRRHTPASDLDALHDAAEPQLRGLEIQVLWHESTTMMLMGPRCLTTLNPGPERPGGWLGIRFLRGRRSGRPRERERCMSLQVVGAGLGRTGTTSLKAALEQLLGGPCYHMLEVRERPADPDAWGDAYEGRPPAWKDFFVGYAATVDWPSAPFWSQIGAVFPMP